jgi:hypothetical protein
MSPALFVPKRDRRRILQKFKWWNAGRSFLSGPHRIPTGKKFIMRYGLVALSLLGMSFLSSPSQADPYLWCAVTGSKASESCTFKTLEQCRTVISATGGACSPNLAYTRRAGELGRRHHALRY